MKLSTDQLERIAERVYKTLLASGHISVDDNPEERSNERLLDSILSVLEDDTRTEDRLAREAEKLVQTQNQVAKNSDKSIDELIVEVKLRLARSKRVVLGDGPERADDIAEKIFKAIWKLDGVDFFSEDQKVINCIARAVYRFRVEDDRVIEAIENVLARKIQDEAFSPSWSSAFDKYLVELRNRQRSEVAASHKEQNTSQAGL